MQGPENRGKRGTGLCAASFSPARQWQIFGSSSPVGRGDPIKALSERLLNSTGHFNGR
jgi:hypothetical protein